MHPNHHRPKRRPTLRGAATAASAIALAAALLVTPTAASAASASWFTDPLTKSERSRLAPVPKTVDGQVSGSVRRTKAWYTTASGSASVPVSKAFGNHMTKGQAVQFRGDALFRVKSSDLTKAAKADVKRLVKSLTQVRTLSCEGYADTDGIVANRDAAKRLSAKRAQKVCALVHDLDPSIAVSSKGYGIDRPQVVGGGAKHNRAENRRVVLVVTGVDRVPNAVVLASVTPGAASAGLRFPAPASDRPITRYEYRVGDGSWQRLTTTVTGNGLTATVGGLPSGVESRIGVRAVSSVGASKATTTRVTPVLLPNAPTIQTWTSDVTVGWVRVTPGADNGVMVTGFEASVDGGPWVAVSFDTDWDPPLARFEGLQPENDYTVQVRATSANGASVPSNSVVLAPRTPP